ncbi:MAG: putative bifunctional diguanylate cyclase/phosphodiesterase, partial [Acidimicrobiales bacterium]
VGATPNVFALSSLCVAVLVVIGLRVLWLLQRLNDQSVALTSSLLQTESVEQRFRLAFEDNMAPMLFTDLHDRVFAANDAFCQMIGFSRDELLGQGSGPFTHPDDVGITEDSFRRVHEGDVDQSSYVKRYVRKDGRVITVEVLRSLARDTDGRPLYHVISERDITDERTLAAQLSDQALHDSLTGLANRALFIDRLAQAHARVEREGGLCAVLLLDLDDFKGVNDSLGHVAGDHLLIEIARRLEHVTRSTDTLSRFGGDEFLYLAEGLTSPEDAELVATRLLGSLTESFTISGTRIEQRASIGVVVSNGLRETQTEFIQDADVALYEAKRSGKGHFVVFTPTMQQRAAGDFTLAQELRHALQSNQLAMHYQPVLDLSSTTIVGFEALMRWRHPERGWVSPSVFIPIAEQSDLIVDLGYFALRESVAAAATWATPPGREPLFVTVNFSARQFYDPHLVEVIEALLHDTGFPSSRLVIELTESTTLADVTESQLLLTLLGALGLSVALDDFGTGFSSLSYLAKLHPQIIKIDQSFVSPTTDSPGNDALLEAIMTLGHRLGMTMLAEGIETTRQLERLRAIGCELGQGFLWSEAVPGSEVSGLLTQFLSISA